ncbi:MAG: sel1 repeat family protein [Clostridia bacterium]|nr:sel1 repeat family protein [Clostridia bacterium]
MENFKYETKRVNSVQEYLSALLEGYVKVTPPKNLYGDIFVELERRVGESDIIKWKFAECLFKGYGCKQDLAKAIEIYKKLAKSNYGPALYSLGFAYYYGGDRLGGFRVDNALAFKFYKRALKQGYGAANYYIGWCYEDGYGVEPNEYYAMKFYLAGAKLGHDRAQFALSRLYENGVPKVTQAGRIIRVDDFNEVLLWRERAAEQGFFAAQRRLAELYFENKNYYDLEKATYWYLKCYQNEDLNETPILDTRRSVIYGLALCYKTAEKYEKAAELFEICKDEKHVPSIIELAELYENGLGVEESLDKAFELYSLAVKYDMKWYSKCGRALYKLAQFYIHGVCVEKDELYGLKYLEKAADSSDYAPAQFYLAMRYETGDRVEQNLERACKLYVAAANSGHEEAVQAALTLQDVIKCPNCGNFFYYNEITSVRKKCPKCGIMNFN